MTEGRGERPRGRGDHGTSACHTGELGFVLKGIGAPRAVALNILGGEGAMDFLFPCVFAYNSRKDHRSHEVRSGRVWSRIVRQSPDLEGYSLSQWRAAGRGQGW